MQDISCKTVKLPHCLRLEQLNEGQELLVTSIRKVLYRGANRYVIGFEGYPSLYLSNYWLERELDGPNVNLAYNIKVKLGVNKTTPSKNKERTVYCENVK
jgi:hypothetical protein